MSLLSLSAAVGSVFVMRKNSFDGGGVGLQEGAAEKGGGAAGRPLVVALLLSLLAFAALAAIALAVFSNFDSRPSLTRRGCAEDGLRLSLSWPDGSPPT